MHTRQSRRSLVRMLGVAAVAVSPPARAFALPFGDIETGGIGMSLPEWEAEYGPGEPGQTYSIYSYPRYNVSMHVGVDRDAGAVDYFYIPIAGKPSDAGMDRELALGMIASLLPQDARKKQSFVRNETPGSLLQITTEIWTSRSLGRVMDGRRSIMVRYTEGGGQDVSLVTVDVEQA